MGLLAVDVGNSDTKLGYFRGPHVEELVRTWRVTTDSRRAADEIGLLFTGLFRGAGIPVGEVGAVVLSSVVPQLDRVLREAFVEYFGCEPRVFSAAEQRLIHIRTERPRELGADLAASAIAARELFGAPAVVIGFGTATTFGAIERGGDYLGAAIAPGIAVSIDALVQRTAKLPQVALEAPPSAIGRDTIAALQSGIVFGFVGQTEAIVSRMKREIGEDAKVIATGGLADVVARHTRIIDAVEPNLVLFGLRRYVTAAGAARVRAVS